MAGHVGDPRIRLEVGDSAGEAATASGMSVMVGTWRRYSCRAVRRPREAALPAVDHRQRERPRARRRPGRQRQRAPRQPLCDGRPPQHRRDTDEDRRDRCPSRRGRSTIRRSARCRRSCGAVPAVALISGVTMPRCRCGTTKAATTRSTPTATATASLRPIRTPASLLPGQADPSDESVTPRVQRDCVTPGPRWTTRRGR